MLPPAPRGRPPRPGRSVRLSLRLPGRRRGRRLRHPRGRRGTRVPGYEPLREREVDRVEADEESLPLPIETRLEELVLRRYGLQTGGEAAPVLLAQEAVVLR